MDKQELVAYTRQYMPAERDACSAEAWGAYQNADYTGAKRLIQEFYDHATEAVAEDTRAFDIEALAQDHNAVLVTAIRTYGNLGPFRPQNWEDFKGVRLFDILLRPDQIACCSTVVEGDSSENLYGSWGVIVGGGTIHQAFPYDATTSIAQGKIESKFAPRLDGIRPAEQINQAINARHRYNEINASVSGIAGLFYCVDEGAPIPRDFPSKTFRDLIAPYEIPQYLLSNGKFYSISSVEDVVLGVHEGEVPPSDIVKASIRPSKAQREEMISYLTGVLTLAPRNAISSGVARGQFAYDHTPILSSSRDNFFVQHERFLTQKANLSLQLYGAMALHAYAELASNDGDGATARRATAIAGAVLSRELYLEYKDRILSSGNLAITTDDLRHYLDHETLPPYLGDH